jgi:hypothetical protein
MSGIDYSFWRQRTNVAAWSIVARHCRVRAARARVVGRRGKCGNRGEQRETGDAGADALPTMQR